MKPVLTKEWQTDKLTYQTDKAKAQSAQRDKGIKTYHTMHVNRKLEEKSLVYYPTFDILSYFHERVNA